MENQLTIAEHTNTPNGAPAGVPAGREPSTLRGALFGVPFTTRTDENRFCVVLDRHALAVAWSYPLRNIVWRFGLVEYTPALDRMLDETIAALTALRSHARAHRAPEPHR